MSQHHLEKTLFLLRLPRPTLHNPSPWPRLSPPTCHNPHPGPLLHAPTHLPHARRSAPCLLGHSWHIPCPRLVLPTSPYLPPVKLEALIPTPTKCRTAASGWSKLRNRKLATSLHRLGSLFSVREGFLPPHLSLIPLVTKETEKALTELLNGLRSSFPDKSTCEWSQGTGRLQSSEWTF